eukprot:6202254-Prymnesium_polylepis.1
MGFDGLIGGSWRGEMGRSAMFVAAAVLVMDRFVSRCSSSSSRADPRSSLGLTYLWLEARYVTELDGAVRTGRQT